MKKLTTLLLVLATIHGLAQITLDHEFFMSDPEFSGDLHTVYLAPDEMVYASWTNQDIFLYDLDYNLTQTIPIAASQVQYVRYITRSLFDCDPDNIEYMVLSGSLGNSLIEIYREDGTLLSEIPFGILQTVGTDQSNDLTPPLQSTSEGTKLLVKIIGDGSESTRVYGLCGEYPAPCCTSDPGGETTGIAGAPPIRYSSAFPNPTSGITTIQLVQPLATPGDIKLFNSEGQEVKTVSANAGQKQIELNLTDLPAGTYLYRIETSEGIKPTGKLVRR